MKNVFGKPVCGRAISKADEARVFNAKRISAAGCVKFIEVKVPDRYEIKLMTSETKDDRIIKKDAASLVDALNRSARIISRSFPYGLPEFDIAPGGEIPYDEKAFSSEYAKWLETKHGISAEKTGFKAEYKAYKKALKPYSDAVSFLKSVE